MASAASLNHAVELTRRLRSLEPTYGPLHPQLEDLNLDGDRIEPVYSLPDSPAGPGYPDTYSPEVHRVADELAALLSAMSVQERHTVVATAEGGGGRRELGMATGTTVIGNGTADDPWKRLP
jgi:hypothetical protein